MLYLYKVWLNTLLSSKMNNLRDMRLPSRPQQRSPFVNASSQILILQSLVPVEGKRGKNSSSDRPEL